MNVVKSPEDNEPIPVLLQTDNLLEPGKMHLSSVCHSILVHLLQHITGRISGL